jgi:hypothetical protein
METMSKPDQESRVRPRLSSDAPDHHRETVPTSGPFHRVWRRFHLAGGFKPVAGALVVGGITAVLATELGFAELALGLAAGYATYRMLRYGIDLKEALTETIQLEREAVH